MRRSASYGKSYEDYLEAIYKLSFEGKKVSVTNLAKILNVKPSSVVEQLRKLSDKKLIIYKKGEEIRLTRKGSRLARQIFERHIILKKFLSEILMLPEEIAEKDACSMEHYLHKDTIERLKKLTIYVLDKKSENTSFSEDLKNIFSDLFLKR
ncbi:MAG: metal-dependent transcriptional regulator [Desulfurococcales archaeon]|jgi:Mn-dependent DtxR family transcriptional regulator|nr:metal-dependent transcriptional regulator [Desulfurococcales archaeon]MCC6062425.1 metal-dependent transcriptional regulator [Desulfurococcales archaeon]NAZ13145.1 metal-dependent transcriptional regulator [Desulfurococcales archaeon]